MGGGSPERVSALTGAVFLSYASEDAEAAQKICGALRAGGIEVWFDQSEMRGGDAWEWEPAKAANRQPGAVSGLRLLRALQLH